MNDDELFSRELHAAREEFVRVSFEASDGSIPTESRLPPMPERDEAFLRLALMSADELRWSPRDGSKRATEYPLFSRSGFRGSVAEVLIAGTTADCSPLLMSCDFYRES